MRTSFLARIFYLGSSRRCEKNRNSKQQQHEPNELQINRRLEQGKRHRAAALHDLAESVGRNTSRQRRGVRQPYAALTFIRWQPEYCSGPRLTPPPYVGGYALCGLLLMAGCQQRQEEAPKAALPTLSVKLVAAKKGDATRSILLPANVLPYQQATLYAKVAGYVKSVNVDKGDSVQASALLADIEVPELIADRAKYKAELAVADLDYRRTSDAQKKAPDLVVPLTVDTARGRYDVANANLERIETLLGFSKITAPFSGVVTARYVDPGALIPAATSGSPARNAALFTVMDFTKVRVQAAVPEIEIPHIKAGLPVKVMVEELLAAKIEGTITRFSHALDEATKTMLAEIELPNPDGTLRPGMYANVRITVERKPDALILPTDAVLFERGRTSVFTVADNKAKRITVKTGFNDNGWVEILDGVKLGDSVIVIGKQAIGDGQPVKVGDL